MAKMEDIGALNNIPKQRENVGALNNIQLAGDVVPMIKDPFVYIEMLLKQGIQPLDTISPLREIYGYDTNEAFEVLNNFLQR